MKYHLYRFKQNVKLVTNNWAAYTRAFGLLQGLKLLYVIRLQKHSGLFSFTVPGYPSLFFMRAGTSDYKVFEEIFVQEAYRVDESVEPEYIIDAGANIGYTSIYYAHRYPTARIIAIEPEQGNFEMLERNAQPYQQIEVLQAALWPSRHPVKVANPDAGSWAFRMEEAEVKEDAEPVQTIETITPDDLLARASGSFADIFKIDIEGAERQVFAANADWLDRVGIVILELHDHIANRHQL